MHEFDPNADRLQLSRRNLPAHFSGNAHVRAEIQISIAEVKTPTSYFAHKTFTYLSKEGDSVKITVTPIAFAVAIVVAALPAHADDVSELRAQIQTMSDRLGQLEAARNKAPVASNAGANPITLAQAPGWNLIHDDDTILSVYGKVDATIASRSNADTKGDRQTGMVVSWMSGNRWGLHGSHVIDKDSGTKVIATLESEFESPTGNMDTPNVLFNRDAWIGFESPSIGKLTFGRQNTLGRDFIQTWGDAFGTSKVDTSEAGWCNNSNMQQLLFYGGGADGVRNDGSVVWKKVMGPWVAGASYAFGYVDNGNGPSTAPGQFSNGSTESAALAFNGRNWNLNGAVTHAVVSQLAHNIAAFGGNYQFGPLVQWKAGVAYARVDQAAVGHRVDHVFSTSIVVTPAGKMRYVFGFHDIDLKNAGYNGAGNTLGVTADTSGVTSAANGKRQTFYGAAFYKFDSQTDVYVAFDDVHTKDGYVLASTHGAGSMNEVGMGLRWSF